MRRRRQDRAKGGNTIRNQGIVRADGAYPFTIDSDIDLGAHLAACVRRSDADVIIREGPVPERIEASAEGVAYQLRRGEALISMPDGTRIHVTEGRRLVYDRGSTTGDRDLVLFLLGTAWGALCYQRGLIPIHASGNLVAGRIVAFTGHSGAGKSTLAANLAKRGFPFFSDDTLIFDPSLGGLGAEHAAMCFAGQKRLKLWGDAIEKTGADARGPVRDFRAIDKHYADPSQQSETRLAPLSKLYVLGTARGDATHPNRIERLRGAETIGALRRNLYREHFAEVLLGREALFHSLKKLVETVEVHRFTRLRTPENYERSLDFIASEITPCRGAAG